jgi:hypothetical protein
VGLAGAAPAGLFVWAGRGSACGVRVAATRVQQTPDFTWFASAKVLQKSVALDAICEGSSDMMRLKFCPLGRQRGLGAISLHELGACLVA